MIIAGSGMGRKTTSGSIRLRNQIMPEMMARGGMDGQVMSSRLPISNREA